MPLSAVLGFNPGSQLGETGIWGVLKYSFMPSQLIVLQSSRSTLMFVQEMIAFSLFLNLCSPSPF